MLWFAFKKLYLCSDEQQLKNNIMKSTVVICFQKIVSLFWRTTKNYYYKVRQKLWFAFKKLYLCSDEQPFDIELNADVVVICFQKIVSLFWRTTSAGLGKQYLELWFAFKKLYLCSDEQHHCCNRIVAFGCDLLSKNCIFVLTNNSF